jgi:hypothetical protein
MKKEVRRKKEEEIHAIGGGFKLVWLEVRRLLPSFFLR